MGNRIQTVAGIIFALAFVAILSMMNTTVVDIGESVNGQLSRTYKTTELQELKAFDDTTVTGATVISTIKNHDSLYTYDMTIEVETGSTTTTYGAGGYDKYTATNASDAKYINPAKSYKAELIQNENDVYTTIKFVEQ